MKQDCDPIIDHFVDEEILVKLGDLVRINESYHADHHNMIGTVIDVHCGVKETVPPGITVMWCDSTIECLWFDVVEIIRN